MDRIESDKLGEVRIPKEALYGINSIRAKDNFPGDIPFHKEWYKATGLVKQACYRVYRKFSEATRKKYAVDMPLKMIPPETIDALENAAIEVSEGLYFSHFIIPAMQGGAGTSINMNINEIITNAALINSSGIAGDYSVIDPIEHANIYQSTNDVIPTALTVASMTLLTDLKQLTVTTSGPVTHRCRKLYRHLSGSYSVPIMMHYHATGGGYQNARKESR